MGNAITRSTCCENDIGDRLPWLIDTFNVIDRVPERTIIQPHVYEKQKDDEESSEKESEDEKTKEEKNKKQIKRNKRSPGLFSWIYGGREEDDEQEDKRQTRETEEERERSRLNRVLTTKENKVYYRDGYQEFDDEQEIPEELDNEDPKAIDGYDENSDIPSYPQYQSADNQQFA